MQAEDTEYYNILMKLLENKEKLKKKKKDGVMYEYFWAYWKNNKWLDKDGNEVKWKELIDEESTYYDDEEEELGGEEWEEEEEESDEDEEWEEDEDSEEEEESDEEEVDEKELIDLKTSLSNYHKNMK